MGSRMINAIEVNDENALFHSVRVNGGQAITHGKDRSSCTRAGNAVTAQQPARLSRRTERQRQRRRSDRENCHYRARERPACEGKNKIAEQGWKKERSAIGKTTLSLSFYRLRPEAPEVSTALKARIIAVAEWVGEGRAGKRTESAFGKPATHHHVPHPPSLHCKRSPGC